MISSPDELIALANEWGILPFFAGETEGFSVEENIAPDCWFSDDPEKGNGAWDWKADCIIHEKPSRGTPRMVCMPSHNSWTTLQT